MSARTRLDGQGGGGEGMLQSMAAAVAEEGWRERGGQAGATGKHTHGGVGRKRQSESKVK